jgi:two-component system response regulator DesR
MTDGLKTSDSTITITIAEDQSLLNSALSQLLDLEDDFHVIGSARDGKQAWLDIARLEPDIAILDIEMPHASGLDVADLISQSALATKAVILTTFAQKAYFERAVRAQVNGYLLKDMPSDTLMADIRRIQGGETIYSPELVRNMFEGDENPLTSREMDVLKAAENGSSTKDIAAQTYLSEGTVRNYLSAIFSKLAARNRLEAISIARRNKWL